MEKKKYSILKSTINKEKNIFEIEELIKRISTEEISSEEFNDSIKEVAFSNDCSLEEFTKKIFINEFEKQSQNKESELMKTFEKSNTLGIYSLAKILFSLLKIKCEHSEHMNFNIYITKKNVKRC